MFYFINLVMLKIDKTKIKKSEREREREISDAFDFFIFKSFELESDNLD